MISRRLFKRNLLLLCVCVSSAINGYGQAAIPADTLKWRLETRLGFPIEGDIPATTTEWIVSDDIIIASFEGSLDQLSLTSPSNDKAKNLSEQLLESNFLGCSNCIGEVELVMDNKLLEAKSGTIAFDGRKEKLKVTVLQEENQLLLTTGIDRRDFALDFNHLGTLGTLMNFILRDTIFLTSSLSLPEALKINQIK